MELNSPMRRRTFTRALSGAIAAAALPSVLLAQSRKPIRIGAAISLSGRYSDSAAFIRDGYKLFIDETNAAGGIGGRPLELVVYDDASSPDTGRVLAERLINRDEVSLILGPYSSPITDAIAGVCERAQVPMLASIASDAGIWERRVLKWTFQAFLSSTYDQESFLSIALTRQCIERGLNVKGFHFITASEGASKSALGTNVAGIFGRSAWEPTLKSAANQRFVAAFQKQYDRAPSYHAATAYASGQVAGAALSTTTDKAGLQKFFATQKVNTVMGNYQVNDRGIQVGYHYVGVQWQGDRAVVVWPDAERQASPIWPKPRWT